MNGYECKHCGSLITTSKAREERPCPSCGAKDSRYPLPPPPEAE